MSRHVVRSTVDGHVLRAERESGERRATGAARRTTLCTESGESFRKRSRRAITRAALTKCRGGRAPVKQARRIHGPRTRDQESACVNQQHEISESSPAFRHLVSARGARSRSRIGRSPGIAGSTHCGRPGREGREGHPVRAGRGREAVTQAEAGVPGTAQRLLSGVCERVLRRRVHAWRRVPAVLRRSVRSGTSRVSTPSRVTSWWKSARIHWGTPAGASTCIPGPAGVTPRRWIILASASTARRPGRATTG